MTTTMSLIAKQTVGSDGASSITFSSIPDTYTDLKIVGSARTNQGAYYGTTVMSLNGSSSNFTYLRMYATGTSVASDTGSTGLLSIDAGASNTANTFGSFEAYIPNYTSQTITKIYITESADESNHANDVYQELLRGLWSASPEKITSITLTAGSSASYVENSTFYLYGISNSTTTQGKSPYANGGDVIATDGTYYYHAFKTSGTFTPLKNILANVLVIAGGGGGGGTHGGGGGAGGVLYSAMQPLTLNTNYSCTIGSGGAGGSSSGGKGANGLNSKFDSLVAIGGGGGGTQMTGQLNGMSGGSGGGGGSNGTGGTPYENQGNDGGAGYGGTDKGGGGGGGAGADGDAAVSSSGYAGAGGVGTSSYSSWGEATKTGENVGGTYYYAGGGAGGDYAFYATGSNIKYGGSGGGGGGSRGTSPGYTIINGTAGLANTGGGGCGGTGNGGAGQNGGSGLVIVRYAI